MKHLLMLVFLSLAIADGSAQQPRKWSRLKGPNIGNLGQKILWGASGEIIAIGYNGFYETTDEGNNWDFRTVFTVNPNSSYTTSGMMITADGTYYFYHSSQYPTIDSDLVGIYRSTDRGNSWNHQIKKISVSQIIEGTDHTLFFNTHKGGSGNYIFESIDKGNSWVEIFNADNNSPIETPLIGSTDKLVFTHDSYNNLYKFSIDDQKLVYFLPPQNANVRGFMMMDSILFAYSDSCFYSTDGEQSWDTLCSLKRIRSMTKGEGNTILAESLISYYGPSSIFSSTNQGKSWDSIAVIPVLNPGVTRVSLNYSVVNRILYEDGTGLYISKDRGNSWKVIGFPYANVYSLVVTDDNRIFIRDNYDSTLVSSDNGFTWQNINPENYNYNSAQIIQALGNIFALTRDGQIWIFDSTSNKWHQKSSFDFSFSYGLITSDKSKYFYISSGYSIFRSDDSGFTWLDMNAPNTGKYINSLEASMEGTLYFGASPVMYRSDDHGATWIRILPIHDPVRLTHIKTFGTSGVLLGTEGDGLLLSSDKGNTWKRIDGNNFDTVTCIAINSKGEIAAGTNHGLWTYDPITLNWTKVILGRDANLSIGGLDVAKNDDFYVGTYGSSVWIGTLHYNSVKYSPSNHSTIQVSPNPTKGKIIITLNDPSEEQIRLELYDILGRKVAVLADGKYSGENQVSFNTSYLANGIYTLILSGAQNETQKIVVQH